MERVRYYFLVFALMFAFHSVGSRTCFSTERERPRVFVFTDINIDAGDPDDRQSLVHLLWYADELDIQGVVPDRWEARGLEACRLVAAAYAKDYKAFGWKKKGYPSPKQIDRLFAVDLEDAVRRFHTAAEKGPLWVLIWGNMEHFGQALRRRPELADNIRLITIGTGLMMEEHRQYAPHGWPLTERPCEQPNWNGAGRNEIFNDPRFRSMWWLEINWTYEGMFTGEGPKVMYEKLSAYGSLGRHIKEVVRNQPWAQYFRVGDTPSVLYVIDPNHDLSDPTQPSWAGRFVKPFPTERPNYFTDDCGEIEWDYADPCRTWPNHVAVRNAAKATLEEMRPFMYAALLEKLDRLYRQ